MEGKDEKDRRPSASKEKPTKPKAEEPEGSIGKWLGYAAACAGIIATVILIFQVLVPLFDDDGTPSAASPKPHLERVDLIAHNPVPSLEPGLELIVRNGGPGRSVISRAQIEILRVDPLNLCHAQGDLSLSGRYGVELSPGLKPGETVEVPLHQQVARNQADRFRIALETRPKVRGGLVQTLYLFEVAVALVHDGEKVPLPMGTALISLPAVPQSEFLLEKGQFKEAVETFSRRDLTARESREEWAPRLACWQENGRTAALAKSSSATRSQDLQEALSSAVVPSYAEIEG